MSNHTPPRACLADIHFMTAEHQMSCCAPIKYNTMTFTSPELLAPSMFDMEDSTPTPEADIYAFGLVIFQVCDQNCEYRPIFIHFI